jgi:hypothetical protein
MSKNIEHLQHKKSNVVIEGKPKLPTANVLVDGELAVNYAEGYETISLRNSNSGITTFSSDDYYTEKKLGSGFTGANSANTVTSVIEENEEIVAAALNDLETKKLDVSAYTPTDLSNYYTKSETSGATEISNALGAKVNTQTFISHTADTNVHVTSGEKESWDAKADESWVEDKLGSAFTGENSANTVTSVIRDNELIISSALNDLEANKLDVSAYTPTDLSNYYTKSQTSSATEISDAFIEAEEQIEREHTTIAAALNDLNDRISSAASESDLDEIVDALNDLIDNVKDKSKTVSAALNDLEVNKLDVSAYTPTDLSNYYTKSETSGATELSDAFDEKADITWVEDKLGSAFTGDNSANTVTSVIEENEEIVSTALNDLDAKKLDVSAYTPTDLSNYYTKSETSGKTEISTELNKYADSVKYNSTSHTIEFYHGTTAGTKVFELDASAFIIDGMVDDVEVSDVESGSTTVKCLVVTFNTDAGKQDINIPLSDIFDPNLYYTKDEIDDSELVISSALNDLEANKLDVSAYTPTDLSNYYTKSETSGATEISTALGTKENTLVIDSTAKTASFNAEVGKYYIVNVPNNGSVTVTLPTTNMSSTNVQNILFLVTLGSGTSSIGFTPISFATEGFNDMEASSTYEVNALWNGTNWIMAMTKLEAVV